MGMFRSKIKQNQSSDTDPQPTTTPLKTPKKGDVGLLRLDSLEDSPGAIKSRNDFPIDIVAIHGLNGGRLTTWQHKNENNWLKDFLPAEFPGARIFSFGYPATKFSRGTGDFVTFGEALLVDLSNVRRTREVVTQREWIELWKNIS